MGFSLLFTLPERTRTFFTKVSADTLWKAITSCRAGGRKKGRMRAFKKPKDLNRGQQLGVGPINVVWPGLNAPVQDGSRVAESKYIKPDPLRMERMLSQRKDVMLIGRGRAAHPMERGWTSQGMQGRKLNLEQYPGAEQFADDYMVICLRTKMSLAMESKGRARYFTNIMAMGNGNGLVGIAKGFTKDARLATKASLNDVPRRLQYVHRLHDHTVYHDFFAQCSGVRIFVQRKPKGFGLRCHRVIQALCELCGITDIHAKVDGNTRNYYNICRAFLTGLLNQETHQELADRKRLHVVEFRRENGYLPKIVASPRGLAIRTEAELDKNEVFDVDEMYGEAKLPYNKPTFKTPFFLTTKFPAYRRKLFLEHPYRNLMNVKLRLISEGIFQNGSKEALMDEAKEAHEKVLLGEKPMPLGVGLSTVLKRALIEEAKEKPA